MRGSERSNTPGTSPGGASRWVGAALWILGALGSITASIAAWREPMWTDAPALPAPRPRPPTPAERAAVEEAANALKRQAEALRAALGRPPGAEELQDSIGAALPDNPVSPGPPSVLLACPAVGEGADWLWCPETGALAPGGVNPG